MGRSTVTRREDGRGRGGGKLLINKNSGKFRTQNIMRSGPGVRRDLLKNTRAAAAERDGQGSGDDTGGKENPGGGHPNSY